MLNNINEDILQYSLGFDNINDDKMCDFIVNLYEFKLYSNSIGYETIIRQCFKYIKKKYGMKKAYMFINKFKFYREKYKLKYV